ncbi:MAG TPA: Gfo/Idh/MocA family oxidoreductase [Acidimicrobiales bacterium]|nr:Gfo/Idh/MocA family oxidoreductase [Acidimicrobiales bacterium]
MTGYGLLGAGMITRLAVGPALVASERCHVAHIGARDRARAGDLAAHLGGSAATAKVSGSYDDVLADPEVDVVYIGLANDAHVPWTLRAIAAGKHVLCEKPLGLGAAEVATAFDAADAAGVALVEASWYRWHPRTRAAEALLGGERATSVDAGFVFQRDASPFFLPGGYRDDPTKGGGALYDVGCYALSAAVWAGAADVTPEAVDVRRSPTGVDVMTDARLRSPTCEVRLRAAFDEPARQWLDIATPTRRISFTHPVFTATARDPASLEVDGEPSRPFDPVDPYLLMVDAVAGRAAGGHDWVVPRADSEAVARLIDAIAASMG